MKKMPKGVYERTEKHRSIMSACHLGRPNHHLGIKRTLETREKIASTMKEQRNTPEWKAKTSDTHTGRKRSLQTKMKISVALKKAYSDPTKSPNWQGGISFEPYCPKFNIDLKRRIREFFGNRCILCGNLAEEAKTKKRMQLSCHHVEYNKSACCDGKPVRFAALCHPCHAKTGQDRARWETIFHRIIDEIYNGRSYFTKEEFQSKLSEAIASESDMKERR